MVILQSTFCTLASYKLCNAGNYKSLQSYQYFIAGWVAEPKWNVTLPGDLPQQFFLNPEDTFICYHFICNNNSENNTYYSVVETSNSAWHGTLILYNNAYKNFTRAVLIKIICGILGYPVTLKASSVFCSKHHKMICQAEHVHSDSQQWCEERSHTTWSSCRTLPFVLDNKSCECASV